jgi:P4 family phage/plasmid primase-like protien
MNTNNKMSKLYIFNKPLNTSRDTTKPGWQKELLILGEEVVTPEIYLNWYKQTGKTTPHYEMLINTDHHNNSFRYYFDYDLKSPNEFSKDDEKEKLNLCLTAIKEFLPSNAIINWCSYNGANLSKTPLNPHYGKYNISYHFVVENYKAHMSDIKNLVKEINKKYPGLFDTGCYGTNQLFRCPMSHKYPKHCRGKGHRKPKLGKKDTVPSMFVSWIEDATMWKYEAGNISKIKPQQNIKMEIQNPIIKEEEELKEDIKEELKEQEEVKDTNDDNILSKLPYKFVDTRDNWLKVTSYYKSLHPDNKESWQEWCKTCDRYIDDWETENNKVWDKVKLCGKVTANNKLQLMINGDYISKRVNELFILFQNPTDESKGDDIMKQFQKYWKVVNYKKDLVYYYNRDNCLWERTNKDMLNSYLTRYYSPSLNELELILMTKPELFGFDDLHNKEQYDKLANILRFIKYHKSTKSKNDLIKEFFTRDAIRDITFENKLNSDKTILSVKGGKVDLKTGKFSKRTYDDYISYELKTKYVEDDDNNKEWIKFLNGIFDNDKIISEQQEIIRYLHKYLGYCITGLTTEEIILILWGKGGNGKVKLQNILYMVLESDIPIIDSWDSSLFSEKLDGGSCNNATPEIAKLYGKRMGFINESKKGVNWGETFKKIVDTGLSLTGRRLYGDPMTFSLETTFLMATNDFPNMPIEDCYNRRTKCLPLLNHYTKNPTAKHHRPITIGIEKLILPDERAKEQILSWLVRGAMKYFREGLDELPPICQSYKDKHFDANDWTKHLEIVDDPKQYMTQQDLYSMINGNTTIKLSPSELNDKLEQLGAIRKRKIINGKKVYIYTGIRENIEEEEEDEYEGCLLDVSSDEEEEFQTDPKKIQSIINNLNTQQYTTDSD